MPTNKPPPRSTIFRRSQSTSFRRDTPARPDCEIASVCGACRYINHDYADALATKFNHEKTQIQDSLGAARMNAAVILGPQPAPRQLGYRSVAKLVVRAAPESTGQSLMLGLYRPGTHDVVDATSCPLHMPSIQSMLLSAREILSNTSITPYDESAHSGDLRYLMVRAAHLTSELLVVFVVTRPIAADLRFVVEELRLAGHNVKSAHMNINPDRGNAILGPDNVVLGAQANLRERMCNLDIEIGPTAFFQVNPWQAENMYHRIETLAGDGRGQLAWDLYCGTGMIGLLLARLGYKVQAIEETPGAVANAAHNARANGLEGNMTFLSGRVENALPQWVEGGSKPSLVVVNPSRRGLAEEARRAISTSLSPGAHSSKHSRTLIYMSCDAETLARDLADICASSGLVLRQLEAFDMFAQTDKLEWLALLGG